MKHDIPPLMTFFVEHKEETEHYFEIHGSYEELARAVLLRMVNDPHPLLEQFNLDEHEAVTFQLRMFNENKIDAEYLPLLEAVTRGVVTEHIDAINETAAAEHAQDKNISPGQVSKEMQRLQSLRMSRLDEGLFFASMNGYMLRVEEGILVPNYLEEDGFSDFEEFKRDTGIEDPSITHSITQIPVNADGVPMTPPYEHQTYGRFEDGDFISVVSHLSLYHPVMRIQKEYSERSETN